MAFTAQDVKTLRERTGCGMMDCKKALADSDGDMDKAIDLLREKGLAASAKKAGRIAAEGTVYAYVDDVKKVGVVIEVNAETDFVAKNAKFMAFVEDCAKTVAEQNPADVEALAACTVTGGNTTVAEALTEKILTIGENIKIRRFVRYEGNLVSYIHAEGKIGVMVKFDVADEIAAKPEFVTYAKDIAMQIAALNAPYLNPEAVPAEVLEKEKVIMAEQLRNDEKNKNKPANIIEKILLGKVKKYYSEVCLLDQTFVKDDSVTVAQYTKNTAKALGGDISVVEYVRFEKGEGLQKREDDFEAEVAKMAGTAVVETAPAAVEYSVDEAVIDLFAAVLTGGNVIAITDIGKKIFASKGAEGLKAASDKFAAKLGESSIFTGAVLQAWSSIA